MLQNDAEGILFVLFISFFVYNDLNTLGEFVRKRADFILAFFLKTVDAIFYFW